MSMTSHLVTVAASRGHYGSHAAATLIVRWMWSLIGWWTLPLVVGVSFAWAVVLGIFDGLRQRKRDQERATLRARLRKRP